MITISGKNEILRQTGKPVKKNYKNTVNYFLKTMWFKGQRHKTACAIHLSTA